MGCYAYCKDCGEGMDKPTLGEIREDQWRCFAGHHNDLRDTPLNLVSEYVEDLMEQVEALTLLVAKKEDE